MPACRLNLATALLASFVILSLGFKNHANAQGVTEKEIVLGTHLDLTGPIAAWGNPIKNGMMMRVEELNAAGGIHGRKIRLIIEDNGYDSKKAVLAIQKLLTRDKVFAVVGALGTPTTGATLPFVQEKGIPHLFPFSAAEFTYKPHNKLNFSFVTPNYNAMRTGIKFHLNKRGKNRVGILYQDDEYGISVLKGVADELRAQGLLLFSKTTYKRGATNFSSQVARLRKDHLDLVALGTTIRETVAVMVEARKIGWDVDFLVSAAGYAPEVAALGKQAVEGLYGVGQTPISYEDTAPSEVAAWMKAYRKRFGEVASVQAISGYLAVDLFAVGATNAGRILTTDSLITGLEQIHDYQDIFGGAPFRFSNKNHLGTTKAFVAQIRIGRWVKLTDHLDYQVME